ncbi:MAG: MFS transporter [Anaerolineae bacterium]|nr:MFS transporter [Anaerolineae bacterium]
MESSHYNTSRKNAALAVAMVSSFLTPFMVAALNIALPAIGEEFGIDAALLGWVGTSYLLAAAIFLVPFGKIADMVGRKRIFLAGISTFTLACALVVLAPSTGFLLAVRAVQGIGAAMIFGTSIAILTSYFPRHERGQALGLSVASTYAGLSIGPFLGGVLVQNLGWRSVMIATIPIGLLSIALFVWKLGGDWEGIPGERLDLVGSGIYGVSLAGLMYGLRLLPDATGGWVVLAGVLGIAGFVWWETRAPNPVLNVRLFVGNRAFAFSNLSALINYSATAAVSFFLSLYLQYVKGFDPQVAGVVLLAQPIVMAVVSPLAGRLSDRIESRVIASIGMALTGFSLALLAFLGESTPTAYVVAAQLLLGLGYAMFSSPNMNAIMGSVESAHYGIASAMVGTMRLIGQMLSMGVAALILAVVVGPVQITPERYADFVTAMRVAFAVFAAFCVGGVFASLARGSIHTTGVDQA